MAEELSLEQLGQVEGLLVGYYTLKELEKENPQIWAIAGHTLFETLNVHAHHTKDPVAQFALNTIMERMRQH